MEPIIRTTAVAVTGAADHLFYFPTKMASSILPSSLPFRLISNGNAVSTPKPPSFFFPPSKFSALRPPTKISASSPPSQPPPDSSDSYPPAETDENVPFKLAFARANEYKKNQPADKPVVRYAAAGSEESKNNRDSNVPLSVKLALEKARQYKQNKGLAGTGGNAAEKQILPELKIPDLLVLDFSEKKKTGGMPAGLFTPVDPFPDGDFPEVEIIVGDTSKFGDGGASKPKLSKEDNGSGLYKPKLSSWGASSSPSNISETNAAVTEEMKGDSSGDIPLSVKLAMEKAKEYKKNKGLTNAGGNAPEEQMEMKLDNQRESVVEKKEELRTSSIDFLGLDFSEKKKKTRGMPAGLVTPVDPFPDGDFPEVEILVGDTSKFGDGGASKTKLTKEEVGSGLYKPKVSSWGASPSPSNISKTNAAVTEETRSDSNGDIPLSVKLAMEKAKDYKKNKGLTDAGANAPEKQMEMKLDNQRDSVVEKKEEPRISSIDFLGLDFSEKKKTRGMPAGLLTPVDPFPDGDFPEVEIIVGDTSKFGDGGASTTKLTMEDEGSGLYKPKVSSWGASPSPSNISKTNAAVTEEMKSDSNGDVPLSFKLAMEKAKEYKKNKGVTNGRGNAPEKQTEMKLDNQRDSVVEKKEEQKISSIDFLGLDFSEKKKTRGMRAGLVTPVDPFSDGDIPEVEILIGDTSRFGDGAASKPKPIQEDDGSVLYKPNVSSWGVFPRPSNISRTFGGGRTIHPGEVLESAEDRAAKEARTKKLLAAYRNELTVTIDPKIKLECEKALDEGNGLMDIGKLKEALPFFEKVMKDVNYRTELHGWAALQWAICHDSLCRPNEAHPIYEKLKLHPNAEVSRKARHLAFGFEAMEMMKVNTSTSFSPTATGYMDYFDAFIDGKSNYSPAEEENENILGHGGEANANNQKNPSSTNLAGFGTRQFATRPGFNGLDPFPLAPSTQRSTLSASSSINTQQTTGGGPQPLPPPDLLKKLAKYTFRACSRNSGSGNRSSKWHRPARLRKGSSSKRRRKFRRKDIYLSDWKLEGSCGEKKMNRKRYTEREKGQQVERRWKAAVYRLQPVLTDWETGTYRVDKAVVLVPNQELRNPNQQRPSPLKESRISGVPIENLVRYLRLSRQIQGRTEEVIIQICLDLESFDNFFGHRCCVCFDLSGSSGCIAFRYRDRWPDPPFFRNFRRLASGIRHNFNMVGGAFNLAIVIDPNRTSVLLCLVGDWLSVVDNSLARGMVTTDGRRNGLEGYRIRGYGKLIFGATTYGAAIASQGSRAILEI
ncbi:hypothetical protein ACLOJK_024705 [Asimina triloba]